MQLRAIYVLVSSITIAVLLLFLVLRENVHKTRVDAQPVPGDAKNLIIKSIIPDAEPQGTQTLIEYSFELDEMRKLIMGADDLRLNGDARAELEKIYAKHLAAKRIFEASIIQLKEKNAEGVILYIPIYPEQGLVFQDMIGAEIEDKFGGDMRRHIDEVMLKKIERYFSYFGTCCQTIEVKKTADGTLRVTWKTQSYSGYEPNITPSTYFIDSSTTIILTPADQSGETKLLHPFIDDLFSDKRTEQ